MCNAHSQTSENTLSHPDPQALYRRKFLQYLGVGGVAAAGGSLASCATNPETGRRQFVGLAPSDAQLAQAAAQSWTAVKQQTPTSNDPRYTSRLRTIGNRISRGAGRGNQAWDYAVFDTDTKNAFVLPGNRVGFYKGMMDFTDNDDQIAAIMGHEVGHVAGRHAAERYSQQVAGQLAVAGGTVLAGTQFGKNCNRSQTRTEYNKCVNSARRNTAYLQQALGLGFMLGVALPYGRRQELESDRLGVRYMAKSGYDPYQAVRLWEKMAEESSGSRGPEFLSTHPTPERRARELSDYITAQEKLGSRGYSTLDIPEDA
ncbi:MAG: M48 family metallopeptidase [Pseudomonadota bacterium]